jgi:hypothetical protein
MTNEEVLRRSWSAVGEIREDQQAQAPVFGVDVRIRPKRLFKALFETLKVILAVKSGGGLAALTQAPIEALGVAPEVAGACESLLGVFYKRISELSYVAALFLGGNAGPTPIADLEAKLPDYMNDLEAAYAAGALPWYLRLTSERIQKAREELRLGMLRGRLKEMENQGLVANSTRRNVQDESVAAEQVEWVESVVTFKGGWG